MWFLVNPTRQITPRTIQVGRTQEFTAPVSKVPPAPFWNKQAIWMIYSHWVVGTFDWVVGTFDCVVGIVNNLLNRNLPFLNVFGYSYCFSASAPFCSFAYTTPACIPIDNRGKRPVCRVVTGLWSGRVCRNSFATKLRKLWASPHSSTAKVPKLCGSNDIDILETESSLETALLSGILCWQLCVCHLLTMEPIGIKVRFFTLQAVLDRNYAKVGYTSCQTK